MQSGKVLRFFAVWDDRGGLYGDRRPYVVHYYLEDDTVEINEVRVQCNVQRWAAHVLVQAFQVHRMVQCIAASTHGRGASGPAAV